MHQQITDENAIIENNTFGTAYPIGYWQYHGSTICKLEAGKPGSFFSFTANANDRVYASITFSQELVSKDKEEVNAAKADLKASETKYKEDFKAWNAKYKESLKKYENGKKMIQKGEENMKKAKDSKKEAEKDIKGC